MALGCVGLSAESASVPASAVGYAFVGNRRYPARQDHLEGREEVVPS